MSPSSMLPLLALLLLGPRSEAENTTGLRAARLRSHVEFLAADALGGRGITSPSLLVAGTYIASQFRAVGLMPGGTDGFFQRSSESAVVNSSPPTVILGFDINGNRLLANSSEIEVLSRSPMRLEQTKLVILDPESLDSEAELDRSNGDTALAVLSADVSRRDGESRAAVLERMTRLQRRAFALSPRAVLICRHGPKPHPGEHITTVNRISSVPTIFVYDNLSKELRLNRSGHTIRLSFILPEPTVRVLNLNNIVGYLRGVKSSKADETILVTAHYDHLGSVQAPSGQIDVYNGANDNASGVAALIEIARTLSERRRKLGRSVLFVAFFGEERGLLGSRYYVENPSVPLATTVGVLNLEQLGIPDREGRYGLTVTGARLSSLPRLLERAGRAKKIRVADDPARGDRMFSASDNYPFAEVGIPSHTALSAYEYSAYHGVGDDWQMLDFNHLGRVTVLLSDAIMDLSNERKGPRWNYSDPVARRYGRASPAHLPQK